MSIGSSLGLTKKRRVCGLKNLYIGLKKWGVNLAVGYDYLDNLGLLWVDFHSSLVIGPITGMLLIFLTSTETDLHWLSVE